MVRATLVQSRPSFSFLSDVENAVKDGNTKTAPKNPCGPSPIEKFTATPANVETTKSQKPQRFHLRSAIAEITLITPQIARAHKAQSGVRSPFRRSHSVPNEYSRAIAEFTMMTNTRYVVRHPCRPDPTG